MTHYKGIVLYAGLSIEINLEEEYSLFYNTHLNSQEEIQETSSVDLKGLDDKWSQIFVSF